MKCYCCDKILTPAESVRKFNSGTYTDMCTKCLSTIDDDVVVQEDYGDEISGEVDDQG